MLPPASASISVVGPDGSCGCPECDAISTASITSVASASTTHSTTRSSSPPTPHRNSMGFNLMPAADAWAYRSAVKARSQRSASGSAQTLPTVDEDSDLVSRSVCCRCGCGCFVAVSGPPHVYLRTPVYSHRAARSLCFFHPLRLRPSLDIRGRHAGQDPRVTPSLSPAFSVPPSATLPLFHYVYDHTSMTALDAFLVLISASLRARVGGFCFSCFAVLGHSPSSRSQTLERLGAGDVDVAHHLCDRTVSLVCLFRVARPRTPFVRLSTVLRSPSTFFF
ncbi:hypothetical protein BV20DRAFT_693501 [Pilatotrama ljubarskyi]|nr:hypothetical protein BV20DRAFT_693501 [Pilatotrama ljubarskyi]